MALALYLFVALATTLACHRWIRPVSRGAAAVLILLPFLAVGPALLTNGVYGGYDVLFLVQPFADYASESGFRGVHSLWLTDHVMQMATWQDQIRESFARGEWPLWNPALHSGDVLAATMQSAPYSPLNLLAMLLPADVATTFTAAMILFLSALFAFLFARELECSGGGSLIAAAGFMLSGSALFWVGWAHLGGSWSLLPLLMLAVRRVAAAPGAAACARLTGVFVLLILFGHPESMLHIVSIGAAYGIFELVQTGRARMRAVGIACGAGITAFLVTAIFLLPFFDALPETEEYRARSTWAESAQPVPASKVWKSVSETFVLRATFIPFGGPSLRTAGRWEDWNRQGARAGSVVIALAIVAATGLWRRREVRFLIGLCIATMLAGWSAQPMAAILNALPLFGMALNDRLAFGAPLAMALLAGMAFDARAGLRGSRLVVVAVGLALALATAWAWRTQWSTDVNTNMLATGAAVELLGIVLLVIALGVRSPRAALLLILGAIAFQRTIEDGRIHPTLPRRMFYPSVPLVEAIPRHPFYRAIGTDTILLPNVGAMYGLEDIRGYTSMSNRRYLETRPLWSTQTRHYHEVRDLGRPFLSFLGVRHAVTPRSMEPPAGWRVVADDRSSRLVENTRAIPRVFVPRNIRFIDSEKTALEEMLMASDFADTAWVYNSEVPTQTLPNGEAVLQVRREGSGYEIDADVRTGSRIVISDVAWPGWRAYIDGRRVKTELANHAFLSLYVPEGKHRLRVVYWPEAFVRGRAITVATLLLLGIAGAGRHLLSRR